MHAVLLGQPVGDRPGTRLALLKLQFGFDQMLK